MILKQGFIKLLGILFFSVLFGNINAQTYLFFQDSPNQEYYDFSWLWVNVPSELELAGSDDHRFPVENTIVPQQGINALKLRWKSMGGGDWQAIAAAIDWVAFDVSDTDTLMFYVFSEEGISAGLIPKVFLEDIDNQQTSKVDVGTFSGNVPANEWFRVVIPMDIFFDAGDPVDFTSIKTIGFQQGTSDFTWHTLYIDDMRIFKGDGTSPSVAAPQGLEAKGYDSHVYLTWQPNTESNLGGYEIYQSTNGGGNFIKRAVVEKEDSTFTHFVRQQGTNLNLHYAIKAVNSSNEPSDFSNIVAVSTYDMTDDELLDMVQEATFRYFWDFGHPVSGMARERNTSGNTVTTGGTGFGIMALLVGIDRAYITRQQGIERMLKLLDFLDNADRFHGVWPHWMNGITGEVIPFSTYDNGGDLVETSFLVQGLLAARQYFDQANIQEQEIVQKITSLWETVEWDWYRRNDGNFLYWHWSPNYNWTMNMPVVGPNEAAIVYILAIASPTHGVPASLWESGWASQGYYDNGGTFYGHKLWVGWDYGGPLFFAHYSYLGFDPRGIKDEHANYFHNNINHTLINRDYCIANPKGFEGYGENCWGLTASDDPWGYLAHEPSGDRDNGTITPTAALSSMPYTPVESMGALKHFYRNLGNEIWGNFGFYDAFNQEADWYATSYLAIDQGPIIDMIENYRSGLLWEKFMANPEIGPALAAIGFVLDPEGLEEGFEKQDKIVCFPNPAMHNQTVSLSIETKEPVSVSIFDIEGREMRVRFDNLFVENEKTNFDFLLEDFRPGFYLIKVNIDGQRSHYQKLIVE